MYDSDHLLSIAREAVKPLNETPGQPYLFVSFYAIGRDVHVVHVDPGGRSHIAPARTERYLTDIVTPALQAAGLTVGTGRRTTRRYGGTEHSYITGLSIHGYTAPEPKKAEGEKMPDVLTVLQGVAFESLFTNLEETGPATYVLSVENAERTPALANHYMKKARRALEAAGHTVYVENRMYRGAREFVTAIEVRDATPYCGECGYALQDLSSANVGGANLCHRCVHVLEMAECKPGACDYSPKFEPVIGQSYRVAWSQLESFTVLSVRPSSLSVRLWELAWSDGTRSDASPAFFNNSVDVCDACGFSVNACGECYRCDRTLWRVTPSTLLSNLGLLRFALAGPLPECDAGNSYTCDASARFAIVDRTGAVLVALCQDHAEFDAWSRAFPAEAGTLWLSSGSMLQDLAPDLCATERKRSEGESFRRQLARMISDPLEAIAVLSGRCPSCADVLFDALAGLPGGPQKWAYTDALDSARNLIAWHVGPCTPDASDHWHVIHRSDSPDAFPEWCGESEARAYVDRNAWLGSEFIVVPAPGAWLSCRARSDASDITRHASLD